MVGEFALASTSLSGLVAMKRKGVKNMNLNKYFNSNLAELKQVCV